MVLYNYLYVVCGNENICREFLLKGRFDYKNCIGGRKYIVCGAKKGGITYKNCIGGRKYIVSGTKKGGITYKNSLGGRKNV